ncbi:MAG TPA: phosphoheptose isomerase [Chryseosolibacter sp.]
MISKAEIFDDVRALIHQHKLTVHREDQTRPWGGFFVLEENEVEKFLHTFFKDMDPAKVAGLKLSPKILLVAPHARLSWQYHHRRAEVWSVVKGPVRVGISDTDEENELVDLDAGNSISLKQGQRHRLIGLDAWGIVAEIWQHTNPALPSDEEDIVRVQDDFNR